MVSILLPLRSPPDKALVEKKERSGTAPPDGHRLRGAEARGGVSEGHAGDPDRDPEQKLDDEPENRLSGRRCHRETGWLLIDFEALEIGKRLGLID